MTPLIEMLRFGNEAFKGQITEWGSNLNGMTSYRVRRLGR